MSTDGALSNVHHIEIPPRTYTRTHRQTTYTLTFIPETKEWHWEFQLPPTEPPVIDGCAPSEKRAIKAAERAIDKVLDIIEE